MRYAVYCNTLDWTGLDYRVLDHTGLDLTRLGSKPSFDVGLSLSPHIPRSAQPSQVLCVTHDISYEPLNTECGIQNSARCSAMHTLESSAKPHKDCAHEKFESPWGHLNPLSEWGSCGVV